MSAEECRSVRVADSFRSYTIHIAGGQAHRIIHRDFVSQSPGGRTIIVYHEDGSFRIVDLGLVTELEAEGAPSSADEQ
jgi:hypothetical protein